MPSEYISPFDFKKIFMEFFLGSQQLFMFAFIILMSYVSAKMGIPNKVFMVLLGIISLMFGLYLGQGVYVFVIFLIGFISFKSIARIVT